MELTVKEYCFDLEEVLNLYKDACWSAYIEHPEKLKKAFENSLLVLGAFSGEKLVGLLRAVGDGITVIFIQDVLVLRQYRRMGIGSKLVNNLLERYKDVRQIELATDNTPVTTAFYRSLGFLEMSEIGCCAFMKLNG